MPRRHYFATAFPAGIQSAGGVHGGNKRGELSPLCCWLSPILRIKYTEASNSFLLACFCCTAVSVKVAVTTRRFDVPDSTVQTRQARGEEGDK